MSMKNSEGTLLDLLKEAAEQRHQSNRWDLPFLPDFEEDQFLVVDNPNSKSVGPKHIIRKPGFGHTACCGIFSIGGSTSEKISKDVDKYVEVVDIDDLNLEDETICKNCVKSYNKLCT